MLEAVTLSPERKEMAGKRAAALAENLTTTLRKQRFAERDSKSTLLKGLPRPTCTQQRATNLPGLGCF